MNLPGLMSAFILLVTLEVCTLASLYTDGCAIGLPRGVRPTPRPRWRRIRIAVVSAVAVMILALFVPS